jgi:hypothetical protein
VECNDVSGRTDTVASREGYETYRLLLVLGDGCKNVYTIFGEVSNCHTTRPAQLLALFE